MNLPVIDIAPLFGRDKDARARAASAIGAACRDKGFFYAQGHGIASSLLAELDDTARVFFSLPEREKLEIAMKQIGRAHV